MVNEKQVEFLLLMIKRLPDKDKIKVFRKLSAIGKLDTLKSILPLSQYNREMVRKMARNTVLRIILHEFEEDEKIFSLGMDRLDEVIEKLDANCASLKDQDPSNSDWLREKIRRMCLKRQDNKILLDRAQPGMVLEKPVLDDSGKVLLGQGAELNESMLLRLKQLDINQITIKVDPSLAEEEDEGKVFDNKKNDKQNEEIIKEMDRRFHGFENNPIMMKIKEAALQCLIAWKAEERKE